MPHIDDKFPQNIPVLTIKGEFLGIAHLTLFLNDFISKRKELLNRMESQG